MILRRLAQNLRDQNWTAITIEFLLLVVGVFLGIQVANWNEARADERAYQRAMARLAEVGAEAPRLLEEQRTVIQAMLEDVRPAIDILRQCSTGEDAEAIVERGLNVARSARGIRVSTLEIDHLVGDERLIARQGERERVALRRYHAELHETNETSEYVLANSRMNDDAAGSLIGFGELVDPSETFNKVDVRRAMLNVPLSEACRHHSLLTGFYSWERAHVYQLALIDELEATVAQSMRELHLTEPGPSQDLGSP